MLKTYNNVLIPDYSAIDSPFMQTESQISIPVKKVRFLVMKWLCGNPVGFEIQPVANDDAFWPMWWGYIDPKKVMSAHISEPGHVERNPQSCVLVEYIRGYYTSLFQKHCSRIYSQAAMPMCNVINDEKIAFKIRPAVHAGGDVYFWCYTHNGTYGGVGVLVDRANSDSSRVDVVPIYIPPSFISKEFVSTMIHEGTPRVREQSLWFPWLPKKISPRLHQS